MEKKQAMGDEHMLLQTGCRGDYHQVESHHLH
jgi:hypothetical protein